MSGQDSIQTALTLIEKDSSAILELTCGSKRIEKPGEILSKAESIPQPTIALPNKPGVYLVICLDLDPPFTSFPVLGPILHWLQSDLTSQGASTLAASVPPIAAYAPANPPPMSAPHRYLFLLYEQPADFQHGSYAPASGQMGLWPRVRWDLAAFEKKAKLGPVVAANFFRCSR